MSRLPSLAAARVREPRRSLGPLLTGLAAALLVSACGDADREGVQDWITRQRAQSRPAPAPITEPKAFVPQAYPPGLGLDPFNSQRLTQALRREEADAETSARVMPERTRTRQPLEAFALDTMAYVGMLVRQGQPVALIRIDRQVHPVRLGAYLGHHYGKVMKITETQVLLREIVQDPSGEWVERAATLALQEDKR